MPSNPLFTYADDSSPTSPKWDSPIRIPGTVSWGPTANNTKTSFYADNIEYFSTYVNNGFDGTWEMAKVPVDMLVAVYRYVVDSNGILIAPGGVGYKNFAFAFEMQGDISPARIIWYSCSAGLPTRTYATMEENTEPQVDSVDMSAKPQTFADGTVATFAQVPFNRNDETTLSIYNNWFSEVYHPSIEDPQAKAMPQSVSGITSEASKIIQEANNENSKLR